MRDALIFTGLMVAVVLAYIAWKLRGRSWREYFGNANITWAVTGTRLGSIT